MDKQKLIDNIETIILFLETTSTKSNGLHTNEVAFLKYLLSKVIIALTQLIKE